MFRAHTVALGVPLHHRTPLPPYLMVAFLAYASAKASDLPGWAQFLLHDRLPEHLFQE